MNMGEILGWSGGTLLLLMTFVQVAPIKVNPWSGLAKKIGRAINGEVLNEIADIKKEQRETQDKLEKHIQDDDERDASMHRQRILRFNIELMRVRTLHLSVLMICSLTSTSMRDSVKHTPDIRTTERSWLLPTSSGYTKTMRKTVGSLCE